MTCDDWRDYSGLPAAFAFVICGICSVGKGELLKNWHTIMCLTCSVFYLFCYKLYWQCLFKQTDERAFFGQTHFEATAIEYPNKL